MFIKYIVIKNGTSDVTSSYILIMSIINILIMASLWRAAPKVHYMYTVMLNYCTNAMQKKGGKMTKALTSEIWDNKQFGNNLKQLK